MDYFSTGVCECKPNVLLNEIQTGRTCLERVRLLRGRGALLRVVHHALQRAFVPLQDPLWLV